MTTFVAKIKTTTDDQNSDKNIEIYSNKPKVIFEEYDESVERYDDKEDDTYDEFDIDKDNDECDDENSVDIDDDEDDYFDEDDYGDDCDYYDNEDDDSEFQNNDLGEDNYITSSAKIYKQIISAKRDRYVRCTGTHYKRLYQNSFHCSHSRRNKQYRHSTIVSSTCYGSDFTQRCNTNIDLFFLIQSNHPDVISVDIEEIFNSRLLDLNLTTVAHALRRNTKIREIIIPIVFLEHLVQETYFCHDHHTNPKTTVDLYKAIRPICDVIMYNPKLRTIQIRGGENPSEIIDNDHTNNGGTSVMFADSAVRMIFQAINKNHSIQSVHIQWLSNVSIQLLSVILTSSESKLRCLKIDSCTFCVKKSTSDVNYSLKELNMFHQNEFHQTDDSIEYDDDNEERNLKFVTVADHISHIFSANKTLEHLELYNVDEACMNAIIIGLRSHRRLLSLTTALPGSDNLEGGALMEQSITNIPSAGWSNAICNVFLASCNNRSNLCILHFLSTRFNVQCLCLLSNAISNNETVNTIIFEYCRFVDETVQVIPRLNGTNTTTIVDRDAGRFQIQKYFTAMFICESKMSVPQSKSMTLVLRQTGTYTNHNPVCASLSHIISHKASSLSHLTTTSLAEKDFVALMKSLQRSDTRNNSGNSRLQSLSVEFNFVKNESGVDLVRCEALVNMIPTTHLKRLQVGLGIGISDKMKEKLLASFQRNSTLQKVDLWLMAAKPFFEAKTEGNVKLDNASFQLHRYQQRNKHLPKLITKLIARHGYNATINQSENGYKWTRRLDDNNGFSCAHKNSDTATDDYNGGILALTPLMLRQALDWDCGLSTIFRTLVSLNFP